MSDEKVIVFGEALPFEVSGVKYNPSTLISDCEDFDVITEEVQIQSQPLLG